MRFKQYIINEIKKHNELLTTFKIIYAKLYKDCKPFLKEIKDANKLIYRGVKADFFDYKKYKSHIKTGRYPMDTPGELHDLLNDLFRKKFKWAVRDGVSVTGNEGTSWNYGTGYIFLPVGNYKFVWSSRISDLFSELEDENMLDDDYNDYGMESNWEDEYGEDGKGHWEYDGDEIDEPDIMRDELKEEGENFDEDKLKWIPDLSYEDYEEDRREEYVDRREDYIKDRIKTYKSGDLKGAIKSQNEIMFDCNEYYLVNLNFEKILLHVIKNNIDPKHLDGLENLVEGLE